MRLIFRRKRRWLKRFVTLSLAVASVLAGLMLVLPIFFQAALHESLIQVGFSEARWNRIRIGLGSTEIEGLQLTPDGRQQIARIAARYSPLDLLRGRVGPVEVSGLRAQWTMGEGGMLMPGQAGSVAAAPPPWRLPPLPFSVMEIVDSQLTFVTPAGTIDGFFTGQIEPQRNDKGTDSVRATLSLSQTGLAAFQVQATAHLENRGPHLTGTVEVAVPYARSGFFATEGFRLNTQILGPNILQARLSAPTLTLAGFSFADALGTFDGTPDAQRFTLHSRENSDAQIKAVYDVRADGPVKGELLTGKQLTDGPFKDRESVLHLLLRTREARADSVSTDAAVAAMPEEATRGLLSVDANFNSAGYGQARVDADLQNVLLPHGGRAEHLVFTGAAFFNPEELRLEGRRENSPAAQGRATDAGENCAPLHGSGFFYREVQLTSFAACVSATQNRADGHFVLTLRDTSAELRVTPDEAEAIGLSFSAHRLIAEGADGAAHLRGETINVTPSALPLRLQVPAATAEMSDKLSLTVPAARLYSAASPAWFTPLEITAGFSGPVSGPYDFSAKLADAAQIFILRTEGRFAPQDKAGEGLIELLPVKFGEGGLDFKALSPWLAQNFAGATGVVGFTLKPTFQDGIISGSGTFLLKDFGLSHANFQFRGMNGVLNLTGLSPSILPDGQEIAIRELSAGLPLSDVRVRFGVRSDGYVFLEKATAQMAGGRVEIAPVLARLADAALDARITLTGVEVAEFLRLASLEGLSGEGRMDGTLPVSIADGAMRVKDGVLTNTGPGVLRYDPAAPPDFLAANAGTVLLRDALKNLRYERLSLTLNGEVQRALSIGLELRGSNPDLQSGRPVHLSVTLQGALGSLLQQAQAPTEVPKAIEAQIEAYEKAKALP